MEAPNPNPFPEIHLFPNWERLKKAAHFVTDRFYYDVPASYVTPPEAAQEALAHATEPLSDIQADLLEEYLVKSRDLSE